jgi:hypothetical protein
MKNTKNNINGLINLKALMIESLKSQGIKESWRMIQIKSTGIYNIYKANR